MPRCGRVKDETRTDHGRGNPREGKGLEQRTGKPSTYGYGKGEEEIEGKYGKGPVRTPTLPSADRNISNPSRLRPERSGNQSFHDVPDPSAILKLADQVDRLTISRRDPERFFEERSEIAAELRRVAHAQERLPRCRAFTPRHPKTQQA